jgi:hypothetical protein
VRQAPGDLVALAGIVERWRVPTAGSVAALAAGSPIVRTRSELPRRRVYRSVTRVRGNVARRCAVKCLRLGAKSIILFVAQFRTCLWPCVDRWASGQEAGQPPKEAN